MTILVAVPDTHFPFVDKDALDITIEHIRIIQPQYVVQMGDLYDFYSFASHHPTSRAVTPKTELAEGRSGAEAFWLAVQSVAPEARCFQILGNHDLRIQKSMREKAPELECLLDTLDLNQLWRFDGVETIYDYREPLEIEGIILHHGFGKLGSHMRRFLKPTIIGHLHKGYIEYMNLWGDAIWELCTGFMGDRDALAFHYTPVKARTWENWQTGYGLVDELGPRFVAL